MATRARAREDYDEGTLPPDRPGSAFEAQVDAVHQRLNQLAEALVDHEERIRPVLRMDQGFDTDDRNTEMKRDFSPVLEAVVGLHDRALGIYEQVIALTARVDI